MVYRILGLKICAAFLVLWVSFAGSVSVAQTPQSSPVVVELFTSQGCSSCPPADALLHKLATRPDVIVLSMNVDYWDYIGWKDEFGSPVHTARQHAYARKASRRSVYTPQMIIGGTESVVGTHPMDVADAIARKRALAPKASVSAVQSGRKLQITASSQRPAAYEIVVVDFTPQRTTQIKRGENAGKTITYRNVVSRIRTVGTWNGRAPLSLSVPASKGPSAVFVQRKGHGAIDAATLVR